MPHQQTRQMALTMVTASIAIALLATSALAMLGQPPASPVPSQFVPAPAAIQDIGPEAFGVLPSIRPQDGNGLDYNGKVAPPNPSSPLVEFSGQREQVQYVHYAFDAMPALPEHAPVIRPDKPPVTEQAVRDIFTRLGLTDPLTITRFGGTWDYYLTASNSAAQFHLDGRGHFSYTAPDLGARCGEATATPYRYPPAITYPTPPGIPTQPPVTPPPPLPTYPPTATATQFGVGTDLCTSRGPAPDDATAIAVAKDFLSKVGFLPDASYTLTVEPPDARLPTLRTVRWAAVAPNGARFVAHGVPRDFGVQRDFTVTVGPNTNVTDASGLTATSGAASSYRLRSAADLAAALQAGEAYATLTLPTTDDGYSAITWRYNQPVAVHVTSAELGYALAYTFDVQPYLIPVVIYTGTANTAESLAIGREIIFSAYVDAVAHPAPQPVPVNPTVPLPTTPDLAALTSYTFTGGLPLTRADFDALATLFGLDNATATIDASPNPIPGGGERILAKYPGGASLSVNGSEGGDWLYNNGGKLSPGPNAPRTAPDVALAVIQQFVTSHHVDLSHLGTPIITQPGIPPETVVCYPLLLDNRLVVDGGGMPECGLRAYVDSGGNRFSLFAESLLVSLQRSGTAALQAMPATGNSATIAGLQPLDPTGNNIVTAQNALDTLATGPKPIPPDADPYAPGTQLARLFIEDEPENTSRHLGNVFIATRGHAAPNLFTADQVTLAYVNISVPTGKGGQRTTYLLPVWLISGQIDIGNRHRIA
ncbi:MAG: hypothetical protein ACYDAR_08450, partial [Thermomicrobiales bacterium]